MSTLDRLKLSTAKKPAHIPTVVFRRNKLSSKLWEQIQLAKSQIDGTTFAVKKFRTVKDKETGLRKSVEVNKRLREWWFKNEQGKVCVSVKYGTKVIELAKGNFVRNRCFEHIGITVRTFAITSEYKTYKHG